MSLDSGCAEKRAVVGRISFWAVIGLSSFLLLVSPMLSSDPPAAQEEIMSLDFQNAGIGTVLRAISDFSGRNIVSGPEVGGEITVRIENVAWMDALDVVLLANGYGWKEETSGIIRVTTLKKLQNEDVEKQAAARKREELLPLVTHIFSVNFSKADELSGSISTVLSKRGDVHVDSRTNSLIIKDIAANVERAGEMIQLLDKETMQVEIVAKLIDIDAKVSRELGIQWLASGLNNPDIDATADVSVNAVTGQQVGEFSVGTVGPGGSLEATLTALATENKARIISNPRITTLDNQEAWILVGKKIPLIVSDPSGNPITELTTIGIELTVTPHIHANGNVTMDLHPGVSDLSSQATVQGGIIIVTAEAFTRVMVKSGQTAVIGGLIRMNKSQSGMGVPFLRNIPLLGHFFSSTSEVNEDRELLIFVTPTILQLQDMGRGVEEMEARVQ